IDLRAGEIHAVIGPNGAGKTTLISQLAGEQMPDSGRIMFDGRDITHQPTYSRALQGIARTFQITNIVHDLPVIENVLLSAQAQAGHSFRFWQVARTDKTLIEPAMEALRRVSLGQRADDISRYLSHGEHRQLEIAMALAANPTLLLLDEPMAGMGAEESARMVDFLTSLKGEKTMLLVEHDMDAVFALADRITVLVNGRAIATGAPDDIRNNEDVRKAYLGDEES
ncbi:MAG TPA: ABC transporter ATP-binding protein, partial [Rhodospirillales bacterium]|nr:ABC transporter ATP-binding protein [Rhodospirillales bacterium]